jgi:hypothetical protein
MAPRCSNTLLGLLALLPLALLVRADDLSPLRSSKRGLCFVPNDATPQDNYIWPRSPSDLTWYYNYGSTPSPVYNNVSQSAFEFVPMLFGAPTNPSSDTSFLDTITGLINGGNNKVNISHVLTFNEPDGSTSSGGSNIDPSVAAQVWVKQIIPLQKLGLKVGLPACTGGDGGIPWTDSFLSECSKLISSDGNTKNCTYDFVTLHWYGNFEGLASHIGQWYGKYNSTIWITEFNYDNQDLATTQQFFNSSLDYFDRLDYVERYSIFGAFRSSVSNVGQNAALLSSGGSLTDMGAWYLGEQGTGILPNGGHTMRVPSKGQMALAAGIIVLAAGLLGA